MNTFLVYGIQIVTVFLLAAALCYFSLKFDIALSLFIGCVAVLCYTAAYWVFIHNMF